ncbi:MAG: hypothetical protein ISS93_01125 [Candidatus Aenigmarchaeota archaeon]|nr:hypothetical protein [Candidatus Aenigmarchaeota archaeon]
MVKTIKKRNLKKEREHYIKRMSAYAAVIVVVVVGLGFGLSSTGFFVSDNPATSNSPSSSLAKCLTANGVEMYGTSTCPACQTQKANFGDSFEYINYIECGPDGNPELCVEKGIEAIPTWIINGQTYVGILSAEKLAELSGCN